MAVRCGYADSSARNSSSPWFRSCVAKSAAACRCQSARSTCRRRAGSTKTPVVETPGRSVRRALRRHPRTARSPNSHRRTRRAAWWQPRLVPSRVCRAFVGATDGFSCAFDGCCSGTSAEPCCSRGGSPRDCVLSPSPWCGSASNVPRIPASWLVVDETSRRHVSIQISAGRSDGSLHKSEIH